MEEKLTKDLFGNLKIKNMKVSIIIGTQFGDEGKGITTDYLCSQNNAKKIVVRFSGGQQAGHNVRIGDVSHIHSSFGSGTLRGVPSYFSEHCTVYPLTMLREKLILQSKGRAPKLYIHPLAKVTTPYDVVWNRHTEKIKKDGSCGLGIAATMKRNIETGHKLFAIDIANPILLKQKLDHILNFYLNKFDSVRKRDEYLELLRPEEDAFMESLKEITFNVQPYEFLKNYSEIIFEGSQGVLLDMDHGIFPNVTFANTTSKNALEICHKIGEFNIEIFYVTRCYQTRHGFGWMSNNSSIELINNEDEINVYNEWQKGFRTGELDYDLLNYALEIDKIYSKELHKNLIITCLDQRPNFDFDVSKLKTNFDHIIKSYSPESKSFKYYY